jgi:hypothetical protein
MCDKNDDSFNTVRRLGRRLALSAPGTPLPSTEDVADAAFGLWADAGIPFDAREDVAVALAAEAARVAEERPDLPATTELSATPLGVRIALVAVAEIYGLLGDEESANHTRALFEASSGLEYDLYRDAFFESMCSGGFDCDAVAARVAADPEFAALLDALGVDLDSESGRKLLGFWSWFKVIVGVVIAIAAVAVIAVAVVAVVAATAAAASSAVGAVVAAGAAASVALPAAAIGAKLAVDGTKELVDGARRAAVDACVASCEAR